MAVVERTIAERLVNTPEEFDFFQAVRLLAHVFPGRKAVGFYDGPSTEVVQFHAHNSLVFPPSEIVSLDSPSDDEGHGPTHMWVAFMGMTGPQGALPMTYTEQLSTNRGASKRRDKHGKLVNPGRTGHWTEQRVREASESLAAFLDIFTHRFVSLMYRAWEKYRFPVAYEQRKARDAYEQRKARESVSRDEQRPARGPERTIDPFSHCLFSIVGLGADDLHRRLKFDDDVLLYYSGLLSQRPRSALALESLLEDFFSVPVRVDQFTGEWFLMNPDTLSGLGTQNCQLGVSTVLWERIMDPQARFRISVGPMDYPQFREFLPDGPAYAKLVEMTRLFVGDEFGFEVRPLLSPDAVPACTLDGAGQRLGWSMWMPTEVPPESIVQPTFTARVAGMPVSEVATA